MAPKDSGGGEAPMGLVLLHWSPGNGSQRWPDSHQRSEFLRFQSPLSSLIFQNLPLLPLVLCRTVNSPQPWGLSTVMVLTFTLNLTFFYLCPPGLSGTVYPKLAWVILSNSLFKITQESQSWVCDHYFTFPQMGEEKSAQSLLLTFRKKTHKYICLSENRSPNVKQQHIF